jgi:hypothetical protein
MAPSTLTTMTATAAVATSGCSFFAVGSIAFIEVLRETDRLILFD